MTWVLLRYHGDRYRSNGKVSKGVKEWPAKPKASLFSFFSKHLDRSSGSHCYLVARMPCCSAPHGEHDNTCSTDGCSCRMGRLYRPWRSCSASCTGSLDTSWQAQREWGTGLSRREPGTPLLTSADDANLMHAEIMR